MENTLPQSVKISDLDKLKDYLISLIPGLIHFCFQIFLAVLLYVIGAKIIGFVRKIAGRALERAGLEKGIRQFLDACLKSVLYFLLVLMILTLFGITTASVIAILGSAGLTIGFALQGSLSNFAGGVLILMLKPFRVGDYIKEDTHSNEGFVKEISIFYTKLHTGDNRTIIIPNGVLANSSMTNVTHSEIRRLDLSVRVSYESDLTFVKEVLTKSVCLDGHVLQEEQNRVFVSELGENAIIMGMQVWVRKEDYWDAKWYLTELIKVTLDKNGIIIPFTKINVELLQKPNV